jgi:hypothetical protein
MFEITETNGSLILIFFPKRTRTNRWFCESGIFKQGVCHTLASPFTLKKYLKAKEELWKLKIFHLAKI